MYSYIGNHLKHIARRSHHLSSILPQPQSVNVSYLPSIRTKCRVNPYYTAPAEKETCALPQCTIKRTQLTSHAPPSTALSTVTLAAACSTWTCATDDSLITPSTFNNTAILALTESITNLASGRCCDNYFNLNLRFICHTAQNSH